MKLAAWIPLAALAVSTAEAQLPSEQLPDTLGANVTEPEGKGSPSDFDFLIGEWTFVFQNRTGASTWGPGIPGRWIAKKSHDGLIVEDTWALSGSPDPTLSWRVFNPARGRWEMQGIKARRGSWDPGIAWGKGDERFVVQTFTGVSQARIRYHRIRPDRFSWRADVSTDGGTTWVRDAWILEATRVR